MFYIVEEDSKLENLKNLLKLGAFVEVIPDNFNYHPKVLPFHAHIDAETSSKET